MMSLNIVGWWITIMILNFKKLTCKQALKVVSIYASPNIEILFIVNCIPKLRIFWLVPYFVSLISRHYNVCRTERENIFWLDLK